MALNFKICQGERDVVFTWPSISRRPAGRQRFVSGTHQIGEEQSGRLPSNSILSRFTSTRWPRRQPSLKDWLPAAGTRRRLHAALVQSGLSIAGGIVGAGGEITWPNATRPGHILQVDTEVLELRPSRSLPDRGIATIRSQTRNQRGKVLQVLVAKLVVPRSTASTSSDSAPSL